MIVVEGATDTDMVRDLARRVIEALRRAGSPGAAAVLVDG